MCVGCMCTQWGARKTNACMRQGRGGMVGLAVLVSAKSYRYSLRGGEGVPVMVPGWLAVHPKGQADLITLQPGAAIPSPNFTKLD